MHSKNALLTLLLSLCLALPAAAQDLPPCTERPGVQTLPRANPAYYCLEFAMQERSSGDELSFTALAFGPGGLLYATRPLTGEVFALLDEDGDGLPEVSQRIASGLDLPNALAYDAASDALYIAGGARIDRYRPGEPLVTLVDDLPAGTGLWTGGLLVHDGWIYVGLGAPCEACKFDDPERGAILRFDLQGQQRSVIARGLRQPLALAWFEDALWATDIARFAAMATPQLDELNRIEPGGHYGAPYCQGANNAPDLPGDFDCAQALPPRLTLPTQSFPAALAPYTGAAFPHLQGRLLLLLGGSFTAPDPRGSEVLAITLEEEGRATFSALLPYDDSITPGGDYAYRPARGYANGSTALLTRRGASFWPLRLLGMAVSPQGWIFLSVSDGQIFALRPR